MLKVEDFELARAVGWPFTSYGGSLHLVGETMYRQALEGLRPLNPADEEQVHRGLLAWQAVAERDRQIEERHAAAAPSMEPDPVATITDEMVAEAVGAAARADTTEGKLDALLEVNREILAALKTR